MRLTDIKIPIPAPMCIQVIRNDGGYLTARCLCCNEMGWLDNEWGYAHNSGVQPNKLIHTAQCEFDKHLQIKVS